MIACFKKNTATLLLLFLLVSSLQCLAAPAKLSSFKLGSNALAQKNYATAVKHFKVAVAEDPNSCACRLGLGKSLCKMAGTMAKGSAPQLQTYKQGALQLRKAIRVGQGSDNAMEANALLLTLPKNLVAPKLGADTAMIALANGISGRERGSEGARPKVLEFYATWCEPCKQLQQVIDKAKGTYGDKVEFISYNVDDPQTEKIVEDYEVSPIPTVIFLNPANEVVSYSIGYSGATAIEQGMKKILPN
ncbi:MAG: thioredoxin fold domain-containing protein [Candidatus Obscuribacterales bacterium]|nr:thioredoxin fold domain-containing protein [Candidatus Obscuribacterales bacterium]